MLRHLPVLLCGHPVVSTSSLPVRHHCRPGLLRQLLPSSTRLVRIGYSEPIVRAPFGSLAPVISIVEY